MRQDIIHGLRTLRRTPLLSAVTVLTLGLGIGANAAIFSIVNGALLKPLPYPDAHRIVQISREYPDESWPTVSTMRLPLPTARYGDVGALDRLNRRLVEGVSAVPGVDAMGLAALLVAAVAGAATLVPARRAASLDPTVAIRVE